MVPPIHQEIETTKCRPRPRLATGDGSELRGGLGATTTSPEKSQKGSSQNHELGALFQRQLQRIPMGKGGRRLLRPTSGRKRDTVKERQKGTQEEKCREERNRTEVRFSDGWLASFLSQQSIPHRFCMNKSQRIPEDYLHVILSWLQFNRRNSQVRFGHSYEKRVVGCYLLDSICNLDKTPLPFKYLDSQTYADKGNHSVQVKASHSGWDKRQATLWLMVFGSGKPRVWPLIIVSGKRRVFWKAGRILSKKEGRGDGAL